MSGLSCTHTGSYINRTYFQVPPPVVDSLGRVVPCDNLDPWDARCGIALALGELSPTLSEEEVKIKKRKHKAN